MLFIFVIFVLITIWFFTTFVEPNFRTKKEEGQKPEEGNSIKLPAYGNFLYRPKRFLTEAEFSYFRKLEEQHGKDYYIIPQVVLSSIVDVDMPRYHFEYKGYRSKIDKKTLDFVLFDKASFIPVLAIELDDYTHQRYDRVQRDKFVNAVLEKVNIKLERVKSL